MSEEKKEKVGRCHCAACCVRREIDEANLLDKKKGIVAWLSLPEETRAAFLDWLRDKPRYSKQCDLAAVDALEQLAPENLGPLATPPEPGAQLESATVKVVSARWRVQFLVGSQERRKWVKRKRGLLPG